MSVAARSTDPQSSQDAADTINRATNGATASTELLATVRDLFRKHGPCTDQVIGDHMPFRANGRPWGESSHRRARLALYQRGEIESAGMHGSYEAWRLKS